MNQDLITKFYENGLISYLDFRFAGFISDFEKKKSPETALAAALVSRNQRLGHICLNLAESGLLKKEKCSPEPDRWADLLRKSSVVGSPGEYAPLILDDNYRLYLHRYWEYQEKLARLILDRIHSQEIETDMPLLEKGLNQLFPSENAEETNWQKVAAFTALSRKFCVISGGPGTGKTTTVAKILSLLTEQAGKKKLRIALTAPTGKAAARLQEAILREKEKFKNHMQESISGDASTLHRLLGSIPGSPYFRYNEKNLLPLDLVVVDEASMVDMALMSKLVQALHDKTRLILLGDKDQLASVEAGAVLGDICDTGSVHQFSRTFCNELKEITGHELICSTGDVPEICDCIVHLQKSYRFKGNSGIYHISREINSGEADSAFQRLEKGNNPDIRWKPAPYAHILSRSLYDVVLKGFKPYLKQEKPEDVFKEFEKFRILCALRRGPFGVEDVNKMIEQILRSKGLINPSRTWYKGRPIMITRNDYHLKLFNGDVGITLPDPDAGGNLRVFFQAQEGKFRKLNPIRLPEHETVYAMTVHKSQGSEFDRVLLLLPDKDVPVLTRELLYTGITRAIHSVEIWSSEEIFKTAVSRTIRRASGLRDALWEKD